MSTAEDKLKQRLTRVIKGEEAAKFTSWQPPSMTGKAVNKDTVKPSEMGSSSSGAPVTAQSLEVITQQAYEEGFEKGIREGRQQGLEQQQQGLKRIESIIASLMAKSDTFDEKITNQLVEMTAVIARHVIRQELKSSPDIILSVIQEVLAMMPSSSENMVLRLHPDDASLIRSVYETNATDELAWKIFEDPSIQAGGCILSSDISEINAELDKRIDGVVKKLLGAGKNDS